MADQYAREGKPVLLLEHDYERPQGVRIDRWYDAFGGQPGFSAPWVMVDSGYQVGGGVQSHASAYRAMIDAALTRPPGAEVAAWYERRGSANLDVIVRVVNRSGVAWTDAHAAAVNVIVYERTRVAQTARYVRASTARLIGTLGDGLAGSFYVPMENVAMGDWNAAMVLALVEYRPNPPALRFEALQAAHAARGMPPTITPSATPTFTPSATATLMPTDTPSPVPTTVPPPSDTATPGPSPTATPRRTPSVVPPAGKLVLPFLYRR